MCYHEKVLQAIFTNEHTVGGGGSPHSNNVLDFIIEHSVARQDPRHSQDREYSTWPVRNSLSGLLCMYL